MSDKVRQIIRSQWSRRHSQNSLVREEARNLIRVHVELLRGAKPAAAEKSFGKAQAAA